MAGLKGKSGPLGNMNAFKHGLTAIQKRREKSITTAHVNQLIDAETADLSLQQVTNPRLCLAKEISRLGLRPPGARMYSRKSIIKSALILRFAASSPVKA